MFTELSWFYCKYTAKAPSKKLSSDIWVIPCLHFSGFTQFHCNKSSSSFASLKLGLIFLVCLSLFFLRLSSSHRFPLLFPNSRLFWVSLPGLFHAVLCNDFLSHLIIPNAFLKGSGSFQPVLPPAQSICQNPPSLSVQTCLITAASAPSQTSWISWQQDYKAPPKNK